MTLEELSNHHRLPQAEKDEKTYNYYYSKYSIEVLEQQVKHYVEVLKTDMDHRIPRITALVLRDKLRERKLSQLGI